MKSGRAWQGLGAVLCGWSFCAGPDSRTPQVEAQAEVLSIRVFSNEGGSQPVQPKQRLFAQRIHIEDIFDIEDAFLPWTNLLDDANEFFHPLITSETPLQHEPRIVVAGWDCDSKHAYLSARTLPFALRWTRR